MTPTTMQIKAKLTPWDDRAFVRAFERARDEVHGSGLLDGPQAGAEVQQLLRGGGYPDARVDVDLTAAEALEHVSHWVVSRDG